MKNIEVGKYAGFCGGVSLCVKKLSEELEVTNEIYCLGELVHNKDVVNKFKEKGVKVVEDISEVPDGAKLVIRAHGAEKHTYEIANKRNMKVLDLTCPKVAKIKYEVEEYINDESYIILIAQKNHPEAKSTISFCGDNSCIVENEQDLEQVINVLNSFKNVVVIAQTTFDELTFLKYAEHIKENVDKNINVIIKNTICNATSVRQEETRNMAKTKDVMIIIGGKNSSNTKKLYNIAKELCNNTYLIETKVELEIYKIKDLKNIGIMAGASTPKEIIDEVVQAIEKI